MKQIYGVVVNHEEQYSIWPQDHLTSLPKGWRAVGMKGDQGACHSYIEEVWTDMRPLSAKQKLDKHAQMQKLIQSQK